MTTKKKQSDNDSGVPEITGHYSMLAKLKRGEWPDKRTKLVRSIECFRSLLKEPYGGSWNALQEARLQLALPWLAFWLLCPVVNKKGRIHHDFNNASGRLEQAIKDIANLADQKPAKPAPNLKSYLEQAYCVDDGDGQADGGEIRRGLDIPDGFVEVEVK